MLRLKRWLGWLMLSLVTTGLVIGCGFGATQTSDNSPTVSSSDCRVVQHDVGEAEICGQPQKVAALSAYTLNLLLSLEQQPTGYAPPLVTLGEVFDNPTQQIPYLGEFITTQPVNLGTDGAPSLEKLTALKPDLIVAEGNNNASNYDLLSQIAPTILWQTRGLPGQWQQNLRSLALALGNGEQADTVIQQYEANVAKAREDLADVVAAHPKLLLIAAQRLDERFGIFNQDSDLVELLSGVGFQLVSPPDSIDLNGPISVEALPMLDEADNIIVLGYDPSGDQAQKSSAIDESASERTEKSQTQLIRQDWEASAIAQSLTASQENRVFFATFYKWNGINGPIGAELVLEQLRQFFLG
ncbi:MAG: iron-siderophore ABC transporter substrate-binding protein [Cyanobacteria bacterium P01_B01_bin.77]